MNPHADQLKFRAWLVKQLTVSRWSAPIASSADELAHHLGVQVSVLREAQAQRDAELKRRGKGGLARGKRRYVAHDYSTVEVRMPKTIHTDWIELCKVVRVEPATVLRSLLHYLLVEPKRPTVTSGRWLYRGKVIHTPRGTNRLARTRITRGAQVALDHHADLWSVSPTAVIRGVVTDFLEGHTKRFRVVAFGELWGDPDRYLHPERFTI